MRRSSLALVAALLCYVLSPSQARAAGPAPAGAAQGLRIVVVEGEDAVNIIQQRTAVAPIVEVRDRNDQPVAGAVVSFAIRGGRATFNGARALTVTTNAAGRAVAAGLTPTGAGPLQISASAAFQGQTAAVTIAQTNVATAAQAAAASAAGTGGAGTSGAAGGVGAGAAGGAASGAGAAAGTGAAATGAATAGGISATTIGIVGAAVAGGAVAVKQVAGGSSGSTVLKGSYTAQSAAVNTPVSPGPGGCTRTFAVQGALTFDYVDNGGTIQGDFDDESTFTVSATTCGGEPVGTQQNRGFSLRVTGTAASLSGSGQRSSAPGPGIVSFETFQFNGSLTGGVLSGTYATTERLNLVDPVSKLDFVSNAGFTVSVALR